MVELYLEVNIKHSVDGSKFGSGSDETDRIRIHSCVQYSWNGLYDLLATLLIENRALDQKFFLLAKSQGVTSKEREKERIKKEATKGQRKI